MAIGKANSYILTWIEQSQSRGQLAAKESSASKSKLIGSDNSTVSLFCLLLCLCGTGAVLKAQNLQMVWADEFEGNSIDPSTWQ